MVFIATVFTVLIVFKWLDSYTNHGEYITLNDLTGLSLKQTKNLLEDKKLNYIIVDSNTFKRNLPHRSVVSQNPLPMDKVKEGRTVYLYISTNKAPMVEVPFLSGRYSKEAGIRALENANFLIGDIIFKPSDDEGNILSLEINGKEIEEGQKVSEGTKIDLIVGGGLTGNKISTPCLIGKTIDEAMFLLNNELNLGHINYGRKQIEDTATAVISSQKPNPHEAIRIGEAIDIFLVQELPYNIEECKNDSTDL